MHRPALTAQSARRSVVLVALAPSFDVLLVRATALAVTAARGLTARLTPLAARLGGLLGGELVRRPLLVGRLTPLAARFGCLLGGELVRRPLLVGRLAPLAGDLALLLVVHRSKTAIAVVGHLVFSWL